MTLSIPFGLYVLKLFFHGLIFYCAFFMKLPIGDIIEGHANELLGLNENISEKRLQICKQCPIYCQRWGGTCNDRLWINPETNEVSVNPKDGYVRGCGCRLPAKTTLPYATCIAGKW